ncbi:MAG: DUF1476 domain-containing protein [Rhodospirillaceae bacterium]|nr:DUF1476 domain-containing protein [Rhodospirillaceae bacterium]
MADAFKNRGAGEEAKFKLNEELLFKVDARRNKLLGQWAATKLGMISDEAEAFVKQVVISDLDEPGFEDVVRHVSKEFKSRGVAMDDDDIRTEIHRLQGVAEEEIRSQYPEPLNGDHGRVGN